MDIKCTVPYSSFMATRKSRPPSLDRPSKRGAKRLEAILAAAERVFLDKGFEGTSLDEVARRAGASKATIYTYFKNKVGLFRAIQTAKLDTVFDAAALAERHHVPIDQALRHLGHSFLMPLLSPVAIKVYRLMVSQGGDFPDLAATWFEHGPRRAIAGVAGVLRAHAAQGEILVSDPEQSAEFFLMMLRGVLHLKAVTALSQPPSEAEVAAKVDAAVEFFMRAHAPAHRRALS